MFGFGVIKGMIVTLGNFFGSYVSKERLTTVQYPEERVPTKPRFRNFPFLVYEEKKEDPRCVACDICAKECPPKCITIVRDKNAEGKPLNNPKTFDIDYSICMNCGICEEVCPFDAIFMDHEFELAEYGRFSDLNYTKERLLKTNTYFQKIRPNDAKRIDEKLAKKKKPAAAAPKPAPPAADKPIPPKPAESQ